MSDEVVVEVDGHGVMLVTLNRPERMNTLNAGLNEGLAEALDRASRDDDVHAIVLTGAGRAFSAGAEISREAPGQRGAPRSRHELQDHFGASGRMVEAFSACDVPVIGAINGPAAGAGFGLALNCDMRFMAESARIGPIFIKRGLSTDYGVAYWLPRIVGAARAYELLYDGGLVDAKRALEVGLANRVVPDDRLLDEATAFARQIASGPPLAYTYVRRLVQRSLDVPQRSLLETEWTYQSSLLRTEDAREGFTSFVEQRAPEFHGR